MTPILYCRMNMDNHWAKAFQGELFTFYVDHFDDNKPIAFSEFKSKVKLTEAFNNGNCVNSIDDDQLPYSIYRKLFFIGEQSQTDGLQFPEEAMQMFTTGIDITLAVDFNRIYVPKDLTPEMDLKPLFANLNKKFSFVMSLFGNNQLAIRVSVSSLEREIHSGYADDEGLGSRIRTSYVTLYFNARIRPVTCPVIQSVKEVEEARMGTEGFFRFCLSKGSPRYVLQVLYSLIFHRKDYKVIKWFDKGYLIFTMERFQRDPNGCLKDAIAAVIESIGNSFVPTEKNRMGEETLAHYYERTSNSFLPIIMGMVDMMQFKGMTPYRYFMKEDTKSKVVSRPLITGEAQDLRIEVKFADSNHRDPLNKKQAELYLMQLETIKQNIAPLIEVIDRTISVLAPFVKDTEYHGNMLSFVSQKLAEDVLVDPSDYVGRKIEGAITQDGLDCIGEYATKIISG